MAQLTITARGQVTFRKDILQHLGLQPGGKLEIDLLPNHKAFLAAARPGGSWQSVVGILKGKGNGRVLSIAEISEAIAASGAEADSLED